jgi:catecholate siderophore receptor
VIADQSMLTMADVVKYIPGVSMGQGEGHRDAPTIRGNSSTADFFVDGVRDDAQYFRDLYNVERVEALKGSNAMVFGRGGGGGVINRVTKEPQLVAGQTFRLEAGTNDHRRGTLDVSRPLTDKFAVRLNGMYEDSRSYRDEVALDRKAINPTLLFTFSDDTRLSAGYEYFTEERTVDRGIPSANGLPSNSSRSTFFGNPDVSFATMTVHNASALLEHRVNDNLTVRNRTRFIDYDKFYQNSFASSGVNENGQLNIGAYNSATPRRNFFNQSEAVLRANTGAIGHTLLAGFEVGHQRTENFRNTGYYNNTATSYAVDFSAPTVSVPITFRQSASDADNNTVVNIASVYVQDQVSVTDNLQAIGGVRFERFDVVFHNNRDDSDLSRQDDLISPRAGLIVKPIDAISIYGSYSISYLPSSGDQFGSLTATTQTLKPEHFTNHEIGAKWDLRPNLSVTLAAFRLDRTNTSAPDPQDATRIVQTGSQRSEGVELGIAGDVMRRWHVVAGLTMQKAEITSRTTAAAPGQLVALVPERVLSLWNRYDVSDLLGVGLGVYTQSDMFAAIDNAVTLPGYTRVDGALFIKAHQLLRLQINVENLLDETYFGTSHGNNNILPGAGRTLRLAVTTRR